MNRQTLEIVSAWGFNSDAMSDTAYGVYDGYNFLYAFDGQMNRFTFSTSVCQGQGVLPNLQTLRSVAKLTKSITTVTAQGFKVNFVLKGGNKQKTIDAGREALMIITRFLRENGFSPCCQSCGSIGAADAYVVGGAASLLCMGCFSKTSQLADMKQQSEKQKRENVLGGVIGALLGSLLGAAVIVILSQLGYVAVLSGLVIAFCTLKGYEMLAGKLSTKGIIISIVIMAIMIYVGNRIDWAISVASYFEVDFFTAFRAIPTLLAEGYIEGGSYYGNLVLVYLFAAGGAIPTIIGMLRQKKVANVTYKMGESIPVMSCSAASVSASNEGMGQGIE